MYIQDVIQCSKSIVVRQVASNIFGCISEYIIKKCMKFPLRFFNFMNIFYNSLNINYESLPIVIWFSKLFGPPIDLQSSTRAHFEAYDVLYKNVSNFYQKFYESSWKSYTFKSMVWSEMATRLINIIYAQLIFMCKIKTIAFFRFLWQIKNSVIINSCFNKTSSYVI